VLISHVGNLRYIYPPTYLPTNLAICLAVCLSAYLSIDPSIHPSIHTSIHPPTYLPTYLPTVLQSSVGPWPLFSFLILYTVGRTPWMGNQPVIRPLPTYRRTQTHNKRNIDIHASSGIRIHDPSVRASEDNSCLSQHGHCDRHLHYIRVRNFYFVAQNLRRIHTTTREMWDNASRSNSKLLLQQRSCTN
jgi:hypothetical protein